MSENKQNYAVPAAIVIAGVLIAGGFYFGDSNSGSTPQRIGKVTLNDLVAEQDIDQKAFDACLASPATVAKVTADIENAKAMDVRGTPFGVIVNKAGNKLAIPGAYPESEIIKMLADVNAATSSDAALVALAPVTENDHALGATDPTYTIIEYSDLRCPFCARFHITMQSLLNSRSDIRWVYRHLPLETLHPDAPKLAIASECIAELGDNNKFWNFIDRVLILEENLITN